jgi:ubiquinone/menaquinone biosynthesis C-methylase UbiE
MRLRSLQVNEKILMTQRVDYDVVAPAYDARYERNRYEGVETALRRFIGEPGSVDVAEVGCGTGHWLASLQGRVRTAAGLDLSAKMLQQARAAAPGALLVRGRADMLPWASASFDRLFCINALHHFEDPRSFTIEARRVLRPNGALLTIGLDPHTGLDTWWIYDYFPGALAADRTRYLPAAAIRELLGAAGFVDAATEVAQHLPAAIPFALAVERGLVDRRATSQLMVITGAEYEQGLHRLRAEQPILHADLRLFATVARTPPDSRA